MQTARTQEAEWRQVLQGNLSMGAKEDGSITGRVQAAGFHHFMTRSRLAHFLKLMNRLFFNFQIFWGLQ
jgi:hypothetical protein